MMTTYRSTCITTEKNLLGDGGLGSHNEKDKKRKSLRSHLSHNAPYLVDGKAARKVGELDGALPTVSLQDEKIVGKSFCYGAELTREIDISRLAEGKFLIRDSVNEESGQPLSVNFFSSEGLYEDDESLLISVNDDKALRISARSPLGVKSKAAYISKEFSKFSGAAAVMLSHRGNGASAIELEVDIDHSKQVLHEVVYRGFGPIQILEAGDWFFDDDYPGNVCHHVMSLRWLGEVKSISVKARILRSFIAYHGSSEKPHSRYYLGRSADHTTSIRLSELLAALKDSKNDAALKSLLRRELAKNIRSCFKSTYKENNNHGLMVDKAILLCLIKDKWLLEKFGTEVSFVISRVEKQLDGIFDKEGYCKEHSTSYQEYNLGIALDLLDVMESGRGLGFDTQIDDLRSRVEQIKFASRKALGFLLKDDGTYVTVGDSFPQPKPGILEKAFGSRDPKTALLPESEQHGVFYNKTLGISVYRDSNIHLVLNASWHSYVHKQNDDLNVFLRVGGEDVFVEGGYSDILSSKDIDTKSELLHSTVTVSDKPWLGRGDVGKGSSFLSEPENEKESGAVTFFGEHTRVNGCSVKRCVTIKPAEGRIIIKDSVEPVKDCLHRFVVPKDVPVEVSESECRLFSQGYNLKLFFESGEVDSCKAWEVSDVEVVSNNDLAKAYALSAISNGGSASFVLTYEAKSQKICTSLGFLSEYQVVEGLEGLDFKVITKALYNSRKAEIFGIHYKFIASLVDNAYCYLLLRSQLTGGVLVLCQHFNNVALIDADKRKIFPVSGASASKALAAADGFFDLSAELFDKIVVSLNEAALFDPVSDKPVRLYCSYSRPYHYFVDFFSRASELYRRGEKVAFLTHPKNEFFEVSDISSDTLALPEDIMASNAKMLDEGVLAMRPVKDLIKPNFKSYHAWSVDMAREINKENNYLNNVLRGIAEYKFKVWLSVCIDGRAWVEQEEGVEKIIEKIDIEARGEAVFLLDSFTRTIGYTRDEFNESISEEAFRYVEELGGRVQESLGNRVNIFNLTGMSSSEKLVVASEIDFYIGNFLTDSMYPCRYNEKPGVGFGANASSYKSHLHPKTEMVPPDKVSDIGASSSWARVSDSISPDWLSDFCLKHFKDRCFG